MMTMVSKSTRLCILALSLVMLASCKDEAPADSSEKSEVVDEADETSTPESPANVDFPGGLECTPESADAIGAWLASWRTWRNRGLQLPAPESGYPEREGDRIRGAASVIRMSSSGIHAGESIEWQSPELGEQLKALARKLSTETNGPVFVAIESDVEARHFAGPLMQLAEMSDQKFGFAFGAPLNDERPLSEEVRRKYPHFFMSRPVAPEVAPVQNCPPAIRYTRAYTRTPESSRWLFAEKNLGRAWLECECKMNLERRLAEMTATFRREPLATSAPWNLSDDGRQIELAPDAKWGEVFGRVVDGKPVALRLAD